MKLRQSSPFSHYRRSLWMETGEVKLEWKQGEMSFSRRQFVSRACDLVVVEQTAAAPALSGRVKLDLYEDGTPYTRQKQQEVGETRKVWTEENRIFYRARNDDGLWFGAVLDVDCDRAASSGKWLSEL